MACSPPPPLSSPPLTPSPPSQSPVRPTPGSALAGIQALLRQVLRISTTDGRVFLGTFAGTDKPLNIILINAEEYRVGPGQNPDGRYVGQVMLPWKFVVKVEGHVKEENGWIGYRESMFI